MAVQIITDSTSELTGDLAETWNVQVLPLLVFFGNECYRDGLDLSSKEFFRKIKESADLPTTSQVTPAQFAEVFRAHREAGREVVGIFISSKLSGTYNSAVLARESLGDKGVYVIDSRTATFCLGAIVIEAARLAKSGRSGAEIADWVRRVAATHMMYGVIDSLDHLRRGGRLSLKSAIVGNILGVKPVITIRDGEVIMLAKARGHKNALRWMLEDAEKNGLSARSGKTVYFAYSLDKSSLEALQEMIMQKYGKREFIELEVGAVVGTHIGPGAIGFCVVE
ncbi:MAG: DegV family protein [Gracilibacteraceae bacterium]|jgi:DegV family protein with EDD domain|nr:DegV family protein [Gracilibacteraceae bacterium]